jgi:hypothetical protein
MNITADLIQMLRSKNTTLTKEYLGTLHILEAEGFPYCSDAMIGMTKTLFSHNLMIAHNMIQNAVDEAKGAARVKVIADKYAESPLLEKMYRHAGDELRHSKMFADAVRLTGYEIEHDDHVGNETADEVLDFDDDLKTFVCRVHSIEVRSWTILRIYIDLLSQSSDEGLKSICPILEEIMDDEIYHVQYTAQQINEWLENDSNLKDTLLSCFQSTNLETWRDLSNICDYMSDNFPKIQNL